MSCSTRCCTCALHASFVKNAVQDIALLVVILFLEDQGCDLNQEAGQFSLHSKCMQSALSACRQAGWSCPLRNEEALAAQQAMQM